MGRERGSCLGGGGEECLASLVKSCEMLLLRVCQCDVSLQLKVLLEAEDFSFMIYQPKYIKRAGERLLPLHQRQLKAESKLQRQMEQRVGRNKKNISPFQFLQKPFISSKDDSPSCVFLFICLSKSEFKNLSVELSNDKVKIAYYNLLCSLR